jgi:AAA domain
MEQIAEQATIRQSFDFNYQELMELAIQRPNAIIESLICERQNVLLMGRFGVGKTMLGLQMSLSLATGRDFVGRKVPKAYRVAIIDCENDLGDVKDRIIKQHDALGLTEQDGLLLKANWRIGCAGDPKSELYGMKFDDDNLGGLPEFVSKHSPEILIIDNLGLVVSKGDLKESDEAKRFYTSLAKLRSENEHLRNGVIIVMHHLTKPGEGLPTEGSSLLTSPDIFLSRARGTGRVLDFAQARLAISEERAGNETYYVLHGINRSTVPVPLILQFNSETLCFEKHENQQLRFEQVFSTRRKGREIYEAWPNVFTWSEAEQMIDPKTGKPFIKDTVNKTRLTCLSEGFIDYNPDTRQYHKVLRLERQT